jgi:hypothetical protein
LGLKRGKKTVKDSINDAAKRMNDNVDKYSDSPVKRQARKYVENLRKKNQKSLKDATTLRSTKKKAKRRSHQ